MSTDLELIFSPSEYAAALWVPRSLFYHRKTESIVNLVLLCGKQINSELEFKTHFAELQLQFK